MNTFSPAPLRLASVLAAMLGVAAPAVAQHHDHGQHATQAQHTSKPGEPGALLNKVVNPSVTSICGERSVSSRSNYCSGTWMSR